MEFACYTHWEQLPDSARTLFEQAAQANLFLSRPWLEGLTATVLEDEQTLALACVEDDGQMLALLPLLHGANNTAYALRHRYTPHYSLLLANTGQVAVIQCLVEGLSRLPFKALLLEPVCDEDGNMQVLQRALETAGYHCSHRFRHYNWILRLQGQGFAEYMAARPARLRNTIARKQRRLEREHGYQIQLYAGDEVPQHMSDYYAVYAASWKANEQFVALVDDLVAGLSRAGWARLAVLSIEGRPAAAQLWFVHHGKASIFRLAYDEAWKAYSPGSILTRYLMQYVIDTDRVDEVDFLTGNEAYKQDWMSERRECVALSCIRPDAPGGRLPRWFQSLQRLWQRH